VKLPSEVGVEQHRNVARRVTRRAVFTLFAFLLMAAASGGGELYRWTGENGTTHYSDQPPPEGKKSAADVLIFNIPEAKGGEAPAQEQAAHFAVPFRRGYGGMLVDVLLNDSVPATMLVDTGSTTVKVNVKLLRRLDRHPPAERRGYQALTAAGPVEAHDFIIEKIELGGAVMHGVQASYTDEKHDSPYYDGLLGLSFLGDFTLTIDQAGGIIHLLRR
jgi:clan AA aspartic protease (TIGR02281 family)